MAKHVKIDEMTSKTSEEKEIHNEMTTKRNEKTTTSLIIVKHISVNY